MNATRTPTTTLNPYAPRLAGGILLASALAGIVYNFQTKSVFYQANYLSELATHAQAVRIGTMIELLMGALTLWSTIILLPYCHRHNTSLTNGFFGGRLVVFTLSLAEAAVALSLLALSEQFAKATPAQIPHFRVVAAALNELHETTHLLRILLSTLPILLFYWITDRAGLLPRFITIWGFVAVPFMMSKLMLDLFHLPSNSLLLVPLGLNQLFLAAWLLAKGFRTEVS